MSVIRSYFFCFLAIDNDIMRKMCTLITSKGTDIDENIANQNHATRTRTPKPGYLNLSISKLLFARRRLESRIEPKIAPIRVYIRMRALQKTNPAQHAGTWKTSMQKLMRLRHFICKHKPYPVWFLRRYASYRVQCTRIA